VVLEQQRAIGAHRLRIFVARSRQAGVGRRAEADVRSLAASSCSLVPVLPGILGYMSMENRAAVPGPEDFDRHLRDVVSGAAGAARYREPSAVERARGASQPGRRQRVSWRNARRARLLRQPVTAGGGERAGSGRFSQWARLRRGRPSAIRRSAPGSRRRQLVSLAKGAGILVGFAALIFVLHMLGLGPQ